ncbi:guanylyltransferase [Methylomonas sp. LL1]|uniref:tRNA(His) guanylyltransferase Thg1 family protein n=1 Tax=Methylomonas sp. LL1 TaxID=2785785 RepID=UPI0018C3D600|nr:tRNA(His) guanylyltransferase Thg1 family protein [Methylomonas sp. LL1]QPK64027.1 guanylyltransferase [Methylomonas sp. LL1]
MRFDELDTMMRVFETNHDHCVLPGLYIVARLDGRSFTGLTRNKHPFEAPYDTRFRDLMLETTRHLMGCGFRAIYGYTQSDEISMLLHPDEDSFSRKERKFISILSGEASAKFSLGLGDLAAFDARLSLLPTVNRVVDYFRWRMEDAARNCLNGHCYWTLRKQGQNAESAALALKGLSNPQKHDLLFAAGTNFNDLPAWQKRGCGVYWQQIEKKGFDPHANSETTTFRRNLKTDFELPFNDAYGDFVRAFIEVQLA